MPRITDAPKSDARRQLAEKIGDLLARAWLNEQKLRQGAVGAGCEPPFGSPRANSPPFGDYNSYGQSRGEQRGEEQGDDAVGRHTA